MPVTQDVSSGNQSPCQVQGDQAWQGGGQGAQPVISDSRAAAEAQASQRGTGAAEREQDSVTDHGSPVQRQLAQSRLTGQQGCDALASHAAWQCLGLTRWVGA